MLDSARVADQLRREIMSGAWPSGAPLRQEHLARSLGVSRIPVRDALTILQAEGLVEMVPHKGAVVAPLSLTAVEEAFAMRIALEPVALRSAFDRLSQSDFGAAEDALEEEQRASTDYDWAQTNWSFHHSFYRATPYPFLLSTLKALNQTASRYLIMGRSTRLRSHASADEHRALLAACRAGHLAEAIGILDAHLHAASETLISHLRSTAIDKRSLA
ncbi:GntR family transcriptional regulator [Methylobacterium sp. P1-11]|uniref:GntR family transcriptional regulator n=1 Tax=Methylobacterium sp. P1-11 TaxID=2024616 RepID=UPI0011EC59A4|nr:GntR family transcriptional regulator [Methylobacterium sp. P1-11]KAA0121973.1 GntR family transcriptional regulator [Methylobacterium sp. P1-11]